MWLDTQMCIHILKSGNILKSLQQLCPQKNKRKNHKNKHTQKRKQQNPQVLNDRETLRRHSGLIFRTRKAEHSGQLSMLSTLSSALDKKN